MYKMVRAKLIFSTYILVILFHHQLSIICKTSIIMEKTHERLLRVLQLVPEKVL